MLSKCTVVTPIILGAPEQIGRRRVGLRWPPENSGRHRARQMQRMHRIPRHQTVERLTNETGTFRYCTYVVRKHRDLRSRIRHHVGDVSFFHGHPYDDNAGGRRHSYQLVQAKRL